MNTSLYCVDQRGHVCFEYRPMTEAQHNAYVGQEQIAAEIRGKQADVFFGYFFLTAMLFLLGLMVYRILSR